MVERTTVKEHSSVKEWDTPAVSCTISLIDFGVKCGYSEADIE